MSEEYPIPSWLNVSRETQDKLAALLALVSKWNKAINLVSASSLQDGWNRHVLDSAQLVLATDKRVGRWLDIGSGAGFPGLVVSIVLDEINPAVWVTLVESDRRKATFLSEAVRTLDLKADVLCGRIEQQAPMNAAIVSARAFAPLSRLLDDVQPHMAEGGVGVFLKGQSHQAEVSAAMKNWMFDCDVIPSRTYDSSVVLRLEKVRHVKS